jgi:hypothetical protein
VRFVSEVDVDPLRKEVGRHDCNALGGRGLPVGQNLDVPAVPPVPGDDTPSHQGYKTTERSDGDERFQRGKAAYPVARLGRNNALLTRQLGDLVDGANSHISHQKKCIDLT